jgi:hypothetical protein
MRRRARPITRTRRSVTAGVLFLTAGLIALLFGLPGVDISYPRYVAFVAGGASLIAGLLLLSLRSGAIAVAAFVAATAFEGPIPADGAAALRVLDGTRVPGYTATARGFVGNARVSPYRLYVGPSSASGPNGLGPSMVEVPAGFELDATGGAATALTLLPLHEGFTSLATWHATRPARAPCTLELETADPGMLAEALTLAPESIRSNLEGKAILRLIASCEPSPPIRPGTSPSNGGPVPKSEQTRLERGGPR